jgi:hypothetical protein
LASLFEPGVVYPSDHVGEYVEVSGVILEVGEPLSDSVSVTIEVPPGVRGEGRHTGYWTGPGIERGDLPPVGGKATLHLYRAGGGWYPDDRVVSWSAGPAPKPAAPRWERTEVV